MKGRRAGSATLIVLVCLGVVLFRRLGDETPGPAPGEGRERGSGAAVVARDSVEDLYRREVGDVWVETSGRVARLLSDDREGSRHQRFLVDLDSGHSLLIVHNIDLAPRVPVAIGDRVEARGEYVWNAKGGLLHWTHHDPSGRLAGGFVRHAGRTYE